MRRALAVVAALLMLVAVSGVSAATPATPAAPAAVAASAAPSPAPAAAVSRGGGANAVCTWQGNHVEWTHAQPQTRTINPDRWAPPVFCLRDTTIGSQHRLVLQNDGNLVLYLGSDADVSCPMWSSGTYDEGARTFALQNDGNLVIRDYNGYPLWNSRSVDWPHGSMWQLTVRPQYRGDVTWHEFRLLPDYRTLLTVGGGCL